MADEETDTEAEDAQEEETQKGGGKSKLIIISVVLVVLAAGGYFATPYIMNVISPPSESDSEVVDETDTSKPALFTSLRPPLVVNLKDEYDDAHFMQITLDVMARDQGIIDEVKNHAAVIRNSLILMYGSVDYEFVITREGKEKMLADALEEIQAIVERETGETGVEAVFFTGLIIQ